MLVCELGIVGCYCLIFFVFYRLFKFVEDFLVCFEFFLDKFVVIGVLNLIIIGDFNFLYINWFIGLLNIIDNLIEFFCNILDDYFFM